jgi:CBS domain-containing protein
MRVPADTFLGQTASDLMTEKLVILSADMPLREAARLLLDNQVSGAPVIDAAGRCVGVLAARDFLRAAVTGPKVPGPGTPNRMPVTCAFQGKVRTPSGQGLTSCLLPPGVCPIQRVLIEENGTETLVCSQPHCVLTDWQVVRTQEIPVEAVRRFMTADPVTVGPETPLRTVARRMIDSRVHRVVVVDEAERPVGIVSSTDVLAAVAYADEEVNCQTGAGAGIT